MNIFDIAKARLLKQLADEAKREGLHDDRCATRKGYACNCASVAFVKREVVHEIEFKPRISVRDTLRAIANDDEGAYDLPTLFGKEPKK